MESKVSGEYNIANRCMRKGKCAKTYCDFSIGRGLSYLVVPSVHSTVMGDERLVNLLL